MSAGRAWLWIVLHLALASGAAVLVLGLRSDVRPHVFLDAHDPVRLSQERFVRQFGPDPFVLVTCRGSGDVAFRARVEELADGLAAAPGVARVERPRPGAPVTEALSLAGADGTRASLLVTLAPGAPGALDAVEAAIRGFDDVAPALAGQPVLNRALQRASDRVGRRLFPVLALAMTLLLALAYRSVRVVAIVLATTGCTVLDGMAVLALLDRPVNLVTVLLPVLLMALTVALGIHLMNGLRIERAKGRRIASAVRATLRAEWRPCLVTSLTTAAGFGSFAFSRIDPLRVLGVAMAASILFAFVCAFTLLPALARLLHPRPREGLALGAALVRFVPRLVASPRLVLAAAAGFVALGLLSAPTVARETNGMNYLPAAHPLRRESERLRREGVGTASLELVVRPAAGRPLSDLAPALRSLEARLGRLGAPVRGVVTPLTLGREAATRLGLPDGAGALALGAAAGPLEAAWRPFRDVEGAAARVSIRIDPIDDVAYASLRGRIDGLARAATGAVAGSSWEWSGEYPIIMTVQTELLRTLLESLAVSTAVIVVVLALAQRSLRRAATTLLPALPPLAFVLLACAATGTPLSIATVMALAVTLGIVTDDSVHVLHALERAPLPEALRRVGTAVTETSIAIFAGFAVLGAADFLPTRSFGLLTAGAMVVALASDLILFPVLLGAGAPRAARLIPSPARRAAPREVST